MTWIFGYGSLVFRPAFPFVERREAYVTGMERRLWQGSPDHRGTPGAPGRVVTLIKTDPSSRCFGIAYCVEERELERVLTYLDVREQGGYARLTVPLYAKDGAPITDEGLVYIATEENAHYLGPASAEEIARHVASAHGPSGANIDYVQRLATALRGMGVEDAHIFAVDTWLSKRSAESDNGLKLTSKE
jgi:glutathione-specific gamma-glutamylcyclotransferase